WPGGDGALFGDAEVLWGSFEQLARYDIVLAGCEGNGYPDSKPQAALDAMKRYVDAGGRLYATHHQRIWITGTNDWRNLATFDPSISGSLNATPATVDEASSPIGPAFASWLMEVGASVSRDELFVDAAYYQVPAIDRARTTRWLHVEPRA